MINQVIQLVQPKMFESVMSKIQLSNDNLIIRPTYLSICHADQRYYRGTREKKVLQQKLPMALIHEATGEVQYDPLNEYRYGEKVVLVPNVPGYLLGFSKSTSVLNEKIGENYCPQGKFRSSGYDGFMQELVSQPRSLVVRTHDKIEDNLFSMTELLSVCMHAFKRFLLYSNGEQRSIGVWGDGNIAFLMALMLKKQMPTAKITVIGKHREKLEMFSFVDEKYLIDEYNSSLELDHMFECVGGESQGEVINRMIDVVRPGATISLLGVSEKKVEVNIRKVLEKGIILIGSSRSGTKDFTDTVEFMRVDGINDYLNMLITNQVVARSITDIHRAFESDSIKPYGKTVIKWEM